MTAPDGALAERLAAVRQRVTDAARAADRDPATITTIVVTKFHPASLVRSLAGLGVRDVGENRHQEASAKAAELADLPLTWHFIGQLQSNKARAVRRYAAVVHSVDRASVLDALAGDEPLDVLLQVNLTDDPGRGGVAPDAVERLAERAVATRGIRLRGLMAVAPLGEPARPAFARVRELGERVRAIEPEASALSMGMSGDFADAIAEGATHLRIGTAITGNRPPQP
ncbi:YggS family pyridoxal phosphate-dependent enzyme [Galbitalea sp. SE-J8]|uniref:YggS family pyridoxal phosphate-dependent enzyme n=1 Tax=Galbitalea sp. SE-J8 TaxID=3054952 RepID=UPI00259D0FFC|nr:YggS family pyridoxal phosphate-dependent enzyme [Galbitalea sp. SE-J8]MDM4764257.1 YggS family pyridoxal phosphate-dependent enzyme [Galbitalea sp. SE-J8]